MRVEKGGGLFCFRSERRFYFILRRSDFLSDGLSKVVFKFFLAKSYFLSPLYSRFLFTAPEKSVVLRSFSKIPKSRSSALRFFENQ